MGAGEGAYLISLDEGFFGEIVAVLVGEGARYVAGADPTVQFADAGGRLFTAFGEFEDRYFLEHGAEPLEAAGDEVRVPELRRVAVCSVECRWPGLFVEVVGRLARAVSEPLWVIDGMDVVWDAAAIDIERLAL